MNSHTLSMTVSNRHRFAFVMVSTSSEGREYDKKGNLHEWWQESTILKFKEKMQCFQEQYSKYTLGKDHVMIVYECATIVLYNLNHPPGEWEADFGGERSR